MTLFHIYRSMVRIMNKNISLFQYYSISEFVKAVLMKLLFSLIPIAAAILTTVNITMLMLPDFYIIITILALIVVLIFALSTKVFVMTLQQYRFVDELNYKRLYIIVFTPLAVTSVGLTYFISSLFI